MRMWAVVSLQSGEFGSALYGDDTVAYRIVLIASRCKNEEARRRAGLLF